MEADWRQISRICKYDDLPVCTTIPPSSRMSIKNAKYLTSNEGVLLISASKLLTAVKWLEAHPPLPEKWEYLNSMAREEIVSA